MKDKVTEDFYSLIRTRLQSNLGFSAVLLANTVNSMKYDCYSIFTDGFGDVSGYIIWANIGKESVLKLKRNGAMPKFPYEWAEGGTKLILDVLFIRGLTNFNRCQLSEFIKSQRSIAYIKNNCFRLIVRKNNKLTYLLKVRLPEGEAKIPSTHKIEIESNAKIILIN